MDLPEIEIKALETALVEELATFWASKDLPLQRAEADGRIAVIASALIAQIMRRHEPGAAHVIIDEGCSPDERWARDLRSAEGAEREVTETESEALEDVVINLADANAVAWKPLCDEIDEHHGLYPLNVDRAIGAGRALLLERTKRPSAVPSDRSVSS